jgi:hypothetical protein
MYIAVCRSQLFLSKHNNTRDSSIKENTNFNFQPSSAFVFLVLLQNMVSPNVVRPLNIHQHTKLHGPTFTGESFIHLRSLDVRNFKVVEASMLKEMR